VSVQDLVTIFPPPLGGKVDFDWSGLSSRLGRSLPDDYKELLSTYGAGKYADFIFVYLPESKYRDAIIGLAGDDPAGPLRGFSEEDNIFGFPYSADELLLWGVTDNGDYLWWLTISDDPNAWEVVVTEAGFGEWYRFDGGMTKFLSSVISGEVLVPVFPEDLIPVENAFAPILDV
jgi:SMI1-KNR4 cell-wall